jgi:hypothetical protein
MTTKKTPVAPDYAGLAADINTLADALIAEGLTDRGVRYCCDIKAVAAQFDPAYVAPEFPEPMSELPV